MHDEEKNCAMDESRQIDVANREDVAYWTKRLGCSEPELLWAIRRAGSDAIAVGAFLSYRRRSQ